MLLRAAACAREQLGQHAQHAVTLPWPARLRPQRRQHGATRCHNALCIEEILQRQGTGGGRAEGKHGDAKGGRAERRAALLVAGKQHQAQVAGRGERQLRAANRRLVAPLVAVLWWWV